MESFRPYSLQYLIDGVSGPLELLSPELQGGYFPKDNTGTALWNPGKSAAVFPFLLNKQRKAVKIWYNQENTGKKEKYDAIKQLYNNLDIPYFSNCQYINNAVSIKDTHHDVLVMDWVGRQNIKEYIIANIHEPKKIEDLAARLLELHKDLNDNGIAHGHLHSGNIYVNAQSELQLIDYDTLFIKGTTPIEKLATTYPDYVHYSQRRVVTVNEHADYFAALIMYLGVKTLAVNPTLWGRFGMGNRDGFIFSSEEFTNLPGSATYASIKKMDVPLLNQLLDILELYCRAKGMHDVRPFYEYLHNQVPLTLNNTVIGDNNFSQPETIREPLVASPASNNKKVAVIMPLQPAPPSQPLIEKNTETAAKEPISNPLPIKPLVPEIPVHREPKKKPLAAEHALSDIWILKDEDANRAIARVFNTQTDKVGGTVKEIKQFTNEDQVAVEETLAATIKFPEKKPGIIKKRMLVGVLSLLVIAGTAAGGVYLVNSKSVLTGFNKNSSENATPEATIQTALPIENAAIVAIEPAKEDSLIATNLLETMPIDTGVTAGLLPDTSSLRDVNNNETVMKSVGSALEKESPATSINNAPQINGEKQAKEQTVNTVVTAPTTPAVAEGSQSLKPTPLSAGSAPAVKKEKKKKPAAADNGDDILSDSGPGKGFNTGINARKQ